jgi:hypothetical protein
MVLYKSYDREPFAQRVRAFLESND